MAAQAERDEEARGLFLAGRAAFERGHYEDALGYFRGSFELSGRADLLYNIGLSAERAGEVEAAEQAFRAYLEDAPAERVEEIEARLQVLESMQAPLPAVAPVSPPTAGADDSAEESATQSDVAATQGDAYATAADLGDSPSPLASDTRADSPGERPWQRKWWVWTLAGAIAGGAIAATLLVRRPDNDGDDLVIQVPPSSAALRW